MYSRNEITSVETHAALQSVLESVVTQSTSISLIVHGAGLPEER
jgi:hypothetical protein